MNAATTLVRSFAGARQPFHRNRRRHKRHFKRRPNAADGGGETRQFGGHRVFGRSRRRRELHFLRGRHDCNRLAGLQINKISPNNDATALSLACLFGRPDATAFLLEHGANPEVSLKDSVSCIIEASRNGNTECARIILDYIGVRNQTTTLPMPPGLRSQSTNAESASRKHLQLIRCPKCRRLQPQKSAVGRK